MTTERREGEELHEFYRRRANEQHAATAKALHEALLRKNSEQEQGTEKQT